MVYQYCCGANISGNVVNIAVRGLLPVKCEDGRVQYLQSSAEAEGLCALTHCSQVRNFCLRRVPPPRQLRPSNAFLDDCPISGYPKFIPAVPRTYCRLLGSAHVDYDIGKASTDSMSWPTQHSFLLIVTMTLLLTIIKFNGAK